MAKATKSAIMESNKAGVGGGGGAGGTARVSFLFKAGNKTRSELYLETENIVFLMKRRMQIRTDRQTE